MVDTSEVLYGSVLRVQIHSGCLAQFYTVFLQCIIFITKYLIVKNIYVSLRLRVQNAVPAQPCVGKLGISLVLLNFLHCNFRLWFKTP